MKTYTLALIAFILALGIGSMQAQTTARVCKGELVCHTLGSHRGFVSWEQSSDGNSWVSIPFMSQDTFCMIADTNGYYRASVSDGTCLPEYSSVMHVIVSEVIVSLGSVGSVCAGSTVTLGGSPTASGGVPPYTYQWGPSFGLNANNIANPVCTALFSTTYVVAVTDSLGCRTIDSVMVNVNAAVVADAGLDQNICFGSTAVLGGSPSGSGGTGALTYLWSPSGDLSSATASNPTVTPSAGPVTYVLTVTDSASCSDMDTVVVDTNNAISHGTLTFAFTGGVQTFVVPPCVDSISMDVYGAQGGANWVNNVNYGGRVTAKLAVTTGETLLVYVGGQPTSGIAGGYNGGGSGDGAGKGGGGGSDVRRGAGTLSDRIIVGGGGGGAGYWSSLHVVGGLGGGLTGGNGYRAPDYATNPGGLGATQSAGGADGTCISLHVVSMAGSFGQGGTPLTFNCGCEGYGGGGGWYGGAGSGNCRGAGGGSSYTIPGAASVVHQQGVRTGNGQVIFTW